MLSISEFVSQLRLNIPGAFKQDGARRIEGEHTYMFAMCCVLNLIQLRVATFAHSFWNGMLRCLQAWCLEGRLLRSLACSTDI